MGDDAEPADDSPDAHPAIRRAFQLDGDAPSHIVAPIIHKARASVARLEDNLRRVELGHGVESQRERAYHITCQSNASVLDSSADECRRWDTPLEDAGAIVEKLKEQKIPFQISANGTSVRVPRDQVHETRLALASEGLPQSNDDQTGY